MLFRDLSLFTLIFNAILDHKILFWDAIFVSIYIKKKEKKLEIMDIL